MRGNFNPKTGKYEIRGKEALQKRDGWDEEDLKEIEEIKRIQAEGGTYLERYAKELGVKPADLWKNILENNSIQRISNVNSYIEFKMLSQTLVEEKSIMKQFLNPFSKYTNIF